MAITEEQYCEITDELDSHEFFNLGDLAGAASNSNLLAELDGLHALSKRALDYSYNEETHGSLEKFLEEVEEMVGGVTGAIEALEKIESVLSKAEEVLSNKLYAEEFEGD